MSGALSEVFQALVPPEDAAEGRMYSVVVVGSGMSLGKDSMGRPAFLIEPSEGSKRPLTAVELPNLRSRHGCEVRVIRGGEEANLKGVSVIECRAAGEGMRELFVRAVGSALPRTARRLTSEELEVFVDHLVELFRASEAPAAGTLLGLWGELFLLNMVGADEQWLRAWHRSPEERIDFMLDSEGVEVKTSSTRRRVHTMSLRQVLPIAGRTTYVVSFQTDGLGSGLSVGDLWTRVSSRIRSPELRGKVDRVVMGTLGRDWSDAVELGFDEVAARSSVKMFRAEKVPRPSGIPPEVSNVRFDIDLSRVAAIDTPLDLPSYGPLTRAIREAGIL